MRRMRSRASLNLGTIRARSLEGKLHAAFAAGFRAVGLLWDEMVQQGEVGVQEVRLSGLVISDLVGVSGWMDADRTLKTMALARAEQAFELAANLGCEVVIAWPTSGAAEDFTAASDFRELCRLAQPFGVQVGLEFVGCYEQINSLAAAWEMVEVAEARNGGLVIDTFHFSRGASTLAMLEPVPGDRIFLVQVSDAMELPRYEMEDRHRIYPGTGVLPLEPLLAVLGEKEYGGFYSLELCNEEYWQEDPLVVAREGMRAMRRLDLT